MSGTLWEISGDLADLEALLLESGGEIDDEVHPYLERYFDDLLERRNTKLDNYVGLIREFQARAMIRRAESQRLAERANVDDNAAKRLKERLQRAFEVNGWKSIETDRARLTLATAGGQQALRINLPAEQLPEEFQRRETVVSVDKEQIRRLLDKGEELPFAELLPRGKYLKIL